jgi:AbrB family looped-hinge helix DNA binding protein
MAKVTSKLQLTLPKRIAEQYGIVPGMDLELVAAGDVIHLVPPGRRLRAPLSTQERLRLFDAATARQRAREKHMSIPEKPPGERDWSRDELYTRDETR